jgi:putative MATE family efflux protein
VNPDPQSAHPQQPVPGQAEGGRDRTPGDESGAPRNPQPATKSADTGTPATPDASGAATPQTEPGTSDTAGQPAIGEVAAPGTGNASANSGLAAHGEGGADGARADAGVAMPGVGGAVVDAGVAVSGAPAGLRVALGDVGAGAASGSGAAVHSGGDVDGAGGRTAVDGAGGDAGRVGWAARPREVDRRILGLALPAFGALVAEPLFLLADSAIVGRLGTVELAGLGVAGALLSSAVGVFVFLAYGTTSLVARRIGAGDTRGALELGVDALWLATAIGVVTAAVGAAAAGPLVRAFGADDAVAQAAEVYLRVSMLGLPAMFVVMAATGVLRGLQDTRTPLAVAIAGAIVNVALNLLFVHGVHLGIGGSALGTSLTQLGMAAVTVVVVVRGARRQGARLSPHRAGILTSARTGVPLLIRTLTMRAVLLVATAVAALQGAPALAAHQVTATVWTLLALALDALAIAGQALTGLALGAGDAAGARAALRRMTGWGIGLGAVLGVVLYLVRDLLAPLFTEDAAVQEAMVAALVVAAVMQPLAGYVFVLDGVLIGAGDGRYLALAGIAQLVVFVPVAVAIGAYGPRGTGGLVLLWLAFAGGWMASRALLLGLRARGEAWLVTGATR